MPNAGDFDKGRLPEERLDLAPRENYAEVLRHGPEQASSGLPHMSANGPRVRPPSRELPRRVRALPVSQAKILMRMENRMVRSISMGLMAFVASSALAACGSPAPATPSSVDARAAPPPADTAKGGATGETTAPAAEATTAGATKAPSGKDPTEKKLRASKSLEAFPTIKNVTKELGAPFAKGKATRRSYWFDKSSLDKTFACDTIDLIRGPSGDVIFYVSVHTSDKCKTVTITKAGVIEVLTTLGGEEMGDDPDVRFIAASIEGKTFDEANALFEKKLGKPHEAGEPDFAAWRYVSDHDGECRVVVVTTRFGWGAGQALWGVPCK
jgi:hypothetical protein